MILRHGKIFGLAPVEEKPVNLDGSLRQSLFCLHDQIAILVEPLGFDAQPPAEMLREGGAIGLRKAFQRGYQRLTVCDQSQGAGELREIPVQRFRLPGKAVETFMVEIGSGETGLPIRCEAPRAIVEAFPADIDIIGIEYAMDKTRGHIGSGQPGDFLRDLGEQFSCRIIGRCTAVILLEAICDQPVHQLFIFLIGNALESADPDMAMTQARHDSRTGGRGFIAARQFLAGFDHREGLGRVDAKRFEHFRRQDLADGPLQGQPAIARPAPWCGTRTLGREIHETLLVVSQLREQKSASITDFGIIGTKLMAVIAQRQRWIEIVGERLESTEMGYPLLVAQVVQPDTLVPAVVSEPENMFGEIGCDYRIANFFSQLGDLDIRLIETLAGLGLRFIWHFPTVAANRSRSKCEHKARCSMSEEKSYRDVYWESDDGLKLHAWDYPSDSGKTPVICIPGLTRNARDFRHLGTAFNGERRILMVDLRGRGASEYARDSSTYNPKQYVSDIIMLMDELEIAKAIFFGTSLGGIVTMLLAKMAPGRVAGALLNDIGPELDQNGLDRIASNVGQGRSFDTWAHAGRDLAENNGDIFPDFTLKDWIAFAKKLYRMNSSGRIKLDYDMKISEPFDSKGGGSGALWNALENMKEIPTLILRGELSDLFSEQTAQKMLEKLDRGELVTVPRVGHAPTLEEPASLDAINQLLHRID